MVYPPDTIVSYWSTPSMNLVKIMDILQYWLQAIAYEGCYYYKSDDEYD